MALFVFLSAAAPARIVAAEVHCGLRRVLSEFVPETHRLSFLRRQIMMMENSKITIYNKTPLYSMTQLSIEPTGLFD